VPVKVYVITVYVICLMLSLRRPLWSTRFPYTTLFRSNLLAAEGVDFLVLEMMEDDVHAARACEAAHATGLPFWIGVSARRRTDGDRKSTRLNSSHVKISYAVFCLKKKTGQTRKWQDRS